MRRDITGYLTIALTNLIVIIIAVTLTYQGVCGARVRIEALEAEIRDLQQRATMLEPWHHHCGVDCHGTPHTAEARRCGSQPRHKARECSQRGR